MLRLPDGHGGWAEPSFHRPLDAGVAAEVIDVCQARGLSLHYYLGGKLYARRFSPWWDIYEGRTASPMQAMDSLLPLKGTQPTKMLIFTKPATVLALRDELAPRLAGLAEVVITQDEYLEFMRPGVNKGAALKTLAGLLGLSREQVAAAGDGNNDVEMLQAAGLAIGIRGGREALRAVATVLVDPPEEDGLARYIEEKLL
jgi:hydroxymethylpyrimidine pyrophosphatase-like HAD family hydrolase